MNFYPLRLLLRFEPDDELKQLRERLSARQELALGKLNALKRGKK